MVISTEQFGLPVPTVPGFVIPGTGNTEPIADPGPRCPLSEWRIMTLHSGASIDEVSPPVNEHWMVMTGSIILGIDGWEIELASHEIALLRAGTRRRLSSPAGVRLIVAQER